MADDSMTGSIADGWCCDERRPEQRPGQWPGGRGALSGCAARGHKIIWRIEELWHASALEAVCMSLYRCACEVHAPARGAALGKQGRKLQRERRTHGWNQRNQRKQGRSQRRRARRLQRSRRAAHPAPAAPGASSASRPPAPAAPPPPHAAPAALPPPAGHKAGVLCMQIIRSSICNLCVGSYVGSQLSLSAALCRITTE